MTALAEVFVDASAWIALGDRSDARHREAAEHYGRLRERSQNLVTTNLVIAEGYIAIRRAAGHGAAMRLLQSLRQSSRVLKVFSDNTLEEEAQRILTRFSDQDFSFADAVS